MHFLCQVGYSPLTNVKEMCHSHTTLSQHCSVMEFVFKLDYKDISFLNLPTYGSSPQR